MLAALIRLVVQDRIRFRNVFDPEQFQIQFIGKTAHIDFLAFVIFADAQKRGNEQPFDSGLRRTPHLLRDSADNADCAVRQNGSRHGEIVRKRQTVDRGKNGKTGDSSGARSVDIAGKLHGNGCAVHGIAPEHCGCYGGKPKTAVKGLSASAWCVVADHHPQRSVLVHPGKFHRQTVEIADRFIVADHKAWNFVFDNLRGAF